MRPLSPFSRLTMLESLIKPWLDRVLLGLLVSLVLAHWVFTFLPHRTDFFREWAGNLVFFPVFFLSALLCFRAAFRCPAQRAPWLWFACGQIGWVTGQAIYTQLSLVQHLSPYPSLADAFYLLLIPCLVTGLLLLNRSPLPRHHRTVVALDTLIVVFALATAYWEVAIAQNVANNHSSLLALLVGLAYPGADLVLIALLMVLCVWRPREIAGPATLALTAGLLCLLLADAGYQIKTVAGTYQVGYTLDSFWTLAVALFGLAATLADAPLARPHVRWGTIHRIWVRNAEFSQLALPYLALLLVLSLASTHYLVPDLESRGVLLGVFVVVVLSSVRQFLTQYEARRLQLSLDLQVRTDPLTGLANRSSLLRLLDQAIERSGPRSQVAVLFIDLDRFKFINDTHGHASGDLLLQEVADRLRTLVGEHDIVARQGGDEFVIVLTRVEDPRLVSDTGDLLLQALSQPFTVGGRPVYSSASIGVTLCPGEAVTATDALKNADMAMYEAKRRGRNTLQFYDQELHRQAFEVQQIELHLREALGRQELSMLYQPLVTLSSGAVKSAEALIRWDSPVLGAISPATFIPVAEQRGLILSIGDWVIDTVFEQLSRWRAEGHLDLRISVNVTPQQFEQDDFIEKLEARLNRWSLPGEAIMIELTEGTLLADLEASNTRLSQLRGLGIQVALDDFGTGYSSLAYLRNLQVDVVKIDRSFIWAMHQDGPTFVQAIVHIAHHLGLRVVAEGIETAEQAGAVEALSCDLGQGYLFARPLSAEQFGEAVRHQVTGLSRLNMGSVG
ncbi:putative bifunctional diguanylate cyclase/phosphodiesterase [Deinococcus altitudinis]|uniref:putative bifunctional diguanylate cyclase/phosphodiesterase n=1 Tax=Deinococcus altitudinis TaxID=468914 RepID=UPI0038917BC0